MKLKYKMTEVKPRIFFLKFKKQYQCGMFFLRYQEYYESSSSKFRGKVFSILEFMDWYVKDRKNDMFTYPEDWGGFNIPGEVICKLLLSPIPDLNSYDLEMKKVYNKCLSKYPDGKFYIIGATENMFGGENVLPHEIAHGFFYTIPEYKKQMTVLVKKLPLKLRKRIFSKLEEVGYTKKVLVDECQAYLATGFSIFSFMSNGKKEAVPFKKLYDKYYKGN